MEKFIKSYSPLLSDTSGLDAILLEMRSQVGDTIETYRSQREEISELARAIREKGSILMLGMGASHAVNEMFSFQLRKAGYDAQAITASEFLYDPVPVTDQVILLTSQSGESVETVKCIDRFPGKELFGITLSSESTLGRNTRAIVASGGVEKAYAGTRSVTLSLAIMAYTCAALGQFFPGAVESAVSFEQLNTEQMKKAVSVLQEKQHLVVTGRSIFSGLAHLFALGSQELSGVPNLCNETGQLRHGPLEVLDADTALVVFRQNGEEGQLAQSFVDIRVKSGCSLIVIDASGMAPLEGSVSIPCPAGNDLVAALSIMDTFQSLMIAYACGKNRYTGIPRYSSKITTSE